MVWMVFFLPVASFKVAAPPPPAFIAFPAPANDSLGRFHLLRGLQCDTAAPGTIDGVRGFLLVQAAGGTPTPVAVGDGACWSPVTDPVALSTARPTRTTTKAGSTTVGVIPSASAATVEAVGELVSAAPVGSFAHHEMYRHLPMGADGFDSGKEVKSQLLREASLLRLLTLQRNSISGAVHRIVGAYDVVAVSRITAGYCRTSGCADASAVDVLGARPSDTSDGSAVELLAYTPPGGWERDNTTRRHVSIDDEDLLALGRATLANPSWLAAAAAAADVPSWRLRASFSLSGWSRRDAADSLSQMVIPLGAPWDDRGYPVDLGTPSRAAIASTEKWLQAVSHVLCAAPRFSFVVSTGGTSLCGMQQRDPSPTLAAVAASVQRMYSLSWVFDAATGGGVRWRSERQPPANPRHPRDESALPPCNFSATRDVVDPAVPVTRPAWLVGRGGREINPAAGAEVSLGRSISACAHDEGTLRPEGGDGGGASTQKDVIGAPAVGRRTPAIHLADLKYAPVVTEARRLSQQYDRARWGVEPPAEPATNADVTLAIIVVLPEAMALVALVLTNPRWGRRDWLAFLLIWAAGSVSTAGIITLAIDEAHGQQWRAAAERVELSVRLHRGTKSDFSRDLRQMPLYKVETLLLAARLGYRDRCLRGLAIGVGCTYMALSVVVGVLAARQTRARSRQRGVELDARSVGSDLSCLHPPIPRAPAQTGKGLSWVSPSLADRWSASAAAADLEGSAPSWHL
ncbi:hypothetical protein MMPV_006351 [Pyropia vietnamensis]